MRKIVLIFLLWREKMTEKQPTFYVSDDKLEHFAENSAKLLELSKLGGTRGRSLRLLEQLRKIRNSVRMAEDYAAAGNIMPKPAEWLTDNWYIAEREGKGAIRDLKNIKLTRSADEKGTPLVIYAAGELVRSGAGEVTKERIMTFLLGFQKVIVLRERELSMFVPALKAALVNELSEVAKNTEEFLIAKKACTISEIRLREEHILAAAAERASTTAGPSVLTVSPAAPPSSVSRMPIAAGAPSGPPGTPWRRARTCPCSSTYAQSGVLPSVTRIFPGSQRTWRPAPANRNISTIETDAKSGSVFN
jgi:hypothetical protein